MTLVFLLMLQTAAGISFDQLAQTALTQNKNLQSAREQLRQAEARMKQAGLRPNPSLDVTQFSDVFFSNEGENGFAVTVSQPFELGDKRGKRLDVAQAEVELAKAEIKESERQLIAQLRSAYLRAAETSARLSFFDRGRGLNQQMAQVMNVRLASGDASRLESHLLQAENSRLDGQRILTETQLAQELFEIRTLAGISAEEPLVLRSIASEKASSVDSQTDLIEAALRDRPDLQAARLRETLTRAGVTLARAQATPNVTGSVRYAREPNISRFATATQPRAFEKDSVLEFGISIPLPLRNREQGNIQEASSKAAQATAEREALEHRVRNEVIAAFSRYQSSIRSLELIRTGVVTETEAGVSITHLAYRLGDAKLTDVIVQQRLLIDAQLTQLSAEAEVSAARANLDAVTGR
jgi:cobalt-zinc-cadmium efflux system outer membrane protein